MTAPGATIEESHPLVAAIDDSHAEVFGSPPERDVVRWFSDASVLTRYGIETVNYGTSSGLPMQSSARTSPSTGSSRRPRSTRAPRCALCGVA